MYNYSTCTSQLLTCPDGKCDEYESLHPSLCPQVNVMHTVFTFQNFIQIFLELEGLTYSFCSIHYILYNVTRHYICFCPLKVKMSLAKRGSSDLSNQTHDFSIFNLYLHYFYFKCLLSNQNRSNFVQDCVKVKDVRMNFLVNSNSHGIGINSARSPNMTCKCDEIACQCFHSSYHVSSVLEAKDLPGKKR